MIKGSSKTKQGNGRRVVVTGLGVISSLGIGWEEFWKNLMAGKSGISKITSFDVSKHDRQYGGEVRGFDPAKLISKVKLKEMGKASQFAVAAAKLAIKDAGLSVEDLRAGGAGVCIGTTMGESQVVEQIIRRTLVNKEKIKENRVLIYPANAISANVGRYFKLTGENLIFSNACAAGNFAIGRAYDIIKSGRASIMLAGGADALSRSAFTGFGRLYAMAPQKCQPFDKDRRGMILGEGSGMLVLEDLGSARKRKAHIYAEIAGYGLSCDAYHMTEPAVEGVSRSLRKSLTAAHVRPEEVDYISAHGTGTKENDKAESDAINRVFGRNAQNIPVSSIKSMLGHSMGASAALESIACCLVIQKQRIPPTINVVHQDKGCAIDCVPNKSRKSKAKVVLNNSQAFGGNNAGMVLKGFNSK